MSDDDWGLIFFSATLDLFISNPSIDSSMFVLLLQFGAKLAGDLAPKRCQSPILPMVNNHHKSSTIHAPMQNHAKYMCIHLFVNIIQ